MSLNVSCQKVVAYKNTKHVYVQLRGTSKHNTLLCGASTAGVALPPMIIFAKSLPGDGYTILKMQLDPKAIDQSKTLPSGRCSRGVIFQY